MPRDKHGRDSTLASYVQYVFTTPQGPGSSSFDTRQTTNQRSSRLFSDDEIYPRRSASLRQKHSVQQSTYKSCKCTCITMYTYMYACITIQCTYNINYTYDCTFIQYLVISPLYCTRIYNYTVMCS